MAVLVRLSGQGLPARMAPAAFGLVRTPEQATGNWTHRVTAWYGTVGVPAPGPSNVMPVPPGPTNGHTAATGYQLFPTLSVVRPSLPRVLPWKIPHGIPGVTYTPVGPNPPQDAVVKPAIKVRTGAGRGRVTNQPRPTFRWRVQGG